MGGGHTPWASPMPFPGHPLREAAPGLPAGEAALAPPGEGRWALPHPALSCIPGVLFGRKSVGSVQRRRSPEKQPPGGCEWHPLGSRRCVALGAARRHPGGFTETPWLATGRSSTGWVRGPWNDPPGRREGGGPRLWPWHFWGTGLPWQGEVGSLHSQGSRRAGFTSGPLTTAD